MFKSGIIVMCITMISRVLGLGRTAIIASFFGATALTDAYFSAFKIANLFRQLLGEGALGTVFIPVYNEKVRELGEEKAKELIFSVLNFLFLFLLLIFSFSFLFSQEIINFTVRGYNAETRILASKLLKIMSIYIIFIGMSGMICAVLNNYKKFAIASSTAIYFNLAIILSALFLKDKYGIYALCIGVVIGGLFQFLVVLPSFLQLTKNYKFIFNYKDPYLSKIFIMLIPMLLGIFAKQFNVVIDQFFASYLSSGGVSALENATRIYNLPLGVFGISIATVVYPSLSRAVSNNEEAKAKESIEMGLKLLMFLVIPSIIALSFLSEEIVRIILEHGNFDKAAVKITSEALMYYSFGLFFYTGNHIMNRTFYSQKNTSDPVKYSIISICINIILNFLLIKTMEHRGLALATSVAAAFNFILLYMKNNKTYISINTLALVKFLLISMLSSILAYFACIFFKGDFIKILVFSLSYISLWGYPLYKRRLDVFKGTKLGK